MEALVTPYSKAFIAVVIIALVIFLERAFPFLLFSRKNPPAIIRFIEKYIPPMVMSCLLIYCLKDISFTKICGTNGFIPYLSGVVVTIVLHIWKRNSLLSIFGGTALYMILIRVI